MTILRSLLSLALALSIVAAAKNANIPPEDQIDPYADPANDPYNPMGYVATNWLTGLSTGVSLSESFAYHSAFSAIFVSQAWYLQSESSRPS